MQSTTPDIQPRRRRNSEVCSTSATDEKTPQQKQQMSEIPNPLPSVKHVKKSDHLHKASVEINNLSSNLPTQTDRSDALSAETQPTSTSTLLDCQQYIIKVCRALMTCVAPSYRLEEYMHKTGTSLRLPLQSFYVPGCMILSFRESDRLSKDVYIVRAEESLNLCKLDDVHKVYKDVIHERINTEEAVPRLDKILARPDKYPPWLLVILYGLASACVGPFSYGARPVDLPIIFLLGSLLGFMQNILAKKSRLYRHCFEITATILTSFIARGFGSINLTGESQFCFSAIAQACLVMILPGFTITNSALELQSKNMVSGAVRMVYGIIFVLFLTFGVTIGIVLYGAMDANATSASQCSTSWPFWWKIIFVPLFTMFYVMINQGRWQQMPAMIILSTIGWTVNHFASQRFTPLQQIGSALGALAAGILANVYSRLVHGLAYSLVYPAIFVQVPGSFAASGSLLSGLQAANELMRNTGSTNSTDSGLLSLRAGYTMVEIAIGISVGLSVSALVVYPIRRKRGRSGIFSF